MWAKAESFGQSSAFLVMQHDGNLVMYDHANRPVWHTHTHGNPGAWFIVQEDGNRVVYAADGRVLWHAGTGCGSC